MMPGKHYILHFFGGLICGFFLESDAASLLNITIKVDVNEKTAIDQSYPTGKLIRSVSIIIEIPVSVLLIVTSCGDGSRHMFFQFTIMSIDDLMQ